MTIKIRDAVTTDAPQIVAFNQALASETEDKSLGSATLLAGVTQLLADSNKGRYWLAVSDGETIGQIMVTWEWSDWRNGYFWWIQSVYVRRDYRRKGVFRALHEQVRQAAKTSDDAIGIRLYVEKENHAAISTYEALDFFDAGYAFLESKL